MIRKSPYLDTQFIVEIVSGGGVAIYVEDDLLEPKISLKSSNLELICLEFTLLHAKAFFMIAWYRPPPSTVDNSSFEAIREVLNGLDSQDREIIFLGDINCDLKTCKKALIQKAKTVIL